MECKEVCIPGRGLRRRSKGAVHTQGASRGDRQADSGWGGERPGWQAAWVLVRALSPAGIVLSLCLCQQVEAFIQTLNIQRADCGRGKAALWKAGSAWGREGLGVVCGHLGLGT